MIHAPVHDTPSHAPPSRTPRAILLVDDQPAVSRMLSRWLSSRGYTVVAAQSGEQALAELARRPFDVVVSDVVMPGAGGLELLQRARALRPDLAFVLMTGYATVDSAVAALRGGASDYLEKPFQPEDLAACVERLLAAQDAARSAAAPPTVADGPGPPGDAAPTDPAGAEPAAGGAAGAEPDLRAARRGFEHRRVLEAVAECDGDKRKAADRLGISLASLYRKLQPGPPAERGGGA